MQYKKQRQHSVEFWRGLARHAQTPGPRTRDGFHDLLPHLTTANISTLTTAPSRSPSSASAPPPPPSPLPARWSLTNRIFNLNPLRSFYAGPPRPPASRLWNPVNSSPRTLAVQYTPQPPPNHQHDDYPNLPLEHAAGGERDEYPLLTLPQQRQSRAPSSLAVERSTGEDSISGRTSIALPRDRRSQTQTPQPAAMAPADTDYGHAPAQPQHPIAADVETGIAATKEGGGPARVSLPGSRRTSMHSARDDGDNASEFPWGPAHPCFPHPNPHVPLKSELYDNTRIIRIKRDWMMAGDLAPTFANLYPEILDPLVNEDDFRVLVKKINDTLTDAFDPFTFRAWVDAFMGVATLWLWEDVGMTGVKRKLANLERWIEEWNAEVGAKEGVRIVPLRRTGYLTLDIQIPDPHLGPDTGSRPHTQEDERDEAMRPNEQYLPYPLTPTLQVNSQPQPLETRS
ncbi:Golgin subfamily A member 7/ERF4 family-domain-containing protein [Phaeosphaeria sp. MPI-PUGE-AT-0046c]|nr:Golgin subfamily A member 7/ERF4 family-domain-containing protein [Phaeosphaeria sp. MPI-PUGE-AT-0046c]